MWVPGLREFCSFRCYHERRSASALHPCFQNWLEICFVIWLAENSSGPVSGLVWLSLAVPTL